ncbi:MAG: hypothetical protein EBY37_10290 [Flavobacteriia bacterium]|nr:hypothetical protein [Flavobacteriia bacterium]
MFPTQRMSYFLLYGILFLPLTSCHLFESTKVPKQDIVTASSWSAQDIGPSFDACDGLDQEAMENCFETTITSSLQDYLNTQLPEANVQFEETVTITLKVDTEGFISISDAAISYALADALPEFEAILYEAVDLLPQAKPAIKSNVGAFVEISFDLPIRILAQEQN